MLKKTTDSSSSKRRLSSNPSSSFLFNQCINLICIYCFPTLKGGPSNPGFRWSSTLEADERAKATR
jgi:hypothetical protein